MERLFNLDLQLIHDTVLLAIAVFVMFVLLSYLLFNPVRKLLKKRQDKIRDDLDAAVQDKRDAAALRQDYQAKIRDIEKEAEAILSDARYRALQNEAKILEEAKEEANRIIERANGRIELERRRAADDMKREMIQIASLMAQKALSASVTAQIQNALVEDALKEIGDQTWQN